MKIKINTKSFLFAALMHLSPFIPFGFCSLLQIHTSSNHLLTLASTAELKVKGAIRLQQRLAKSCTTEWTNRLQRWGITLAWQMNYDVRVTMTPFGGVGRQCLCDNFMQLTRLPPEHFFRRQANVYWRSVACHLFMSVVLARVLRKGARVLRIGAQDTQRT